MTTPASPTIARLERERLIRVSGAQARNFLHGQLSQNMDDVTPSQALRAAACTPKGRAYGLLLVARDGDDFVLRCPTEVLDPLLHTLNKYRPLFRGTTMDVEPAAEVYGLLGQAAAQTLMADAGSQLTHWGATLTTPGGLLIRVPDTAEGLQRYEFWRLQPDAAELPAAFKNQLGASAITWAHSEIAAGVATLTPATLESYVPQMLNWQHLQGIHFKKGCYTGQEIIARMHFLGQLKKSLYRLISATPHAPVIAGTPVMGGEESVGEVVNCSPLEDGRLALLAVLRHDRASAPLSLPEQGAALHLQPLPYTVPEQQPDTPSMSAGTDT
ncbi:MAG: folate-binding protein [Marinobacter sp.]|nr:folate-binding protein [Marinobacter sp.]